MHARAYELSVKTPRKDSEWNSKHYSSKEFLV